MKFYEQLIDELKSMDGPQDRKDIAIRIATLVGKAEEFLGVQEGSDSKVSEYLPNYPKDAEVLVHRTVLEVAMKIGTPEQCQRIASLIFSLILYGVGTAVQMMEERKGKI